MLVHPETFVTFDVHLVVDAAGLAIGRPVHDDDGGAAGPARWCRIAFGDLAALGADEGVTLPDGTDRQVLEVRSGRGVLTFLVAAPDVVALVAAVERRGRAADTLAAGTPAPERLVPDPAVGVAGRAAGALAIVGAATRPAYRAVGPLRRALQSLDDRLSTVDRGGRRGTVAAIGVLALAVLVAGLGALTVSGPSASGVPRGHAAAFVGNRTIGAGVPGRLLLGGEVTRRPAVVLPAATAPPAPAPPSLSNAPPLSPHEVFGFAPYWTLPQSGSFDVAGLTTIAYFSVGVNADGSLDRTGSGWAGYQSQALADLITRAHAAGDRVVLTVNDFDQSSLDHLTSSPTASTTLAAQLVSAIEAKHLDGVNLDLEGEGSGDQAGLTTLVTTVSNALHGVDPHWQVTMDTYASSAGDPHGFYNITALAPHVDGFFVMAYQLNLQGAPGAASPLTSGMFSNRTSAAQYASAVDPSKVIFGLPFFGYDWPTSGDTLTATATGAPTAVTYAQAVSDGGPAYWDPVTDTAWTAYQVGKQWHEVFYEDATSLYQVAQVAQWFHFAGVGIWALGMQGGDPAPLAALDGFAPPVKVAVTGPPVTTTTTTSSTTTTTAPKKNAPTPAASTTTTSTTGTSTTTTSTGPSSTTTSTVAPTTTTTAGPGGDRSSGTWKGQPVSLTVLDTAPTGTRVHAGTLTGFTTDDPALSCLEAEPTLNVYAYGTDPAVDVVVAAEPADCTTVLLALGPAPPGATTGSSTAPTP